jgi:tRNA(Ser,Leu) C12 N-acetylase TAN1
MYEVDHIKSLSDIPDNISNLLAELKEFKEDFNIEIEYCKDRYKITLRESTVNRGLNTTRCILMQISENPCSYSIHLFNGHLQNSSNKELKKIYEIEVEGENDFRLIKQDVKDLIEGKKGATFSSNYPL